MKTAAQKRTRLATVTGQVTYTGSSGEPLRFTARRSPVVATRGMVAASQPMAVEAGLSVLKAGGNAVDAAVAVAAALAVTEPCSTGLGGDAFLLVFDPVTRKVHALNGSGRSPEALDTARVKRDCPRWGAGKDLFHPHTITVPGAAAAWEDALRLWGRSSLEQVLAPALRLAEEGFPVAPITALHWNEGAPQLTRWPHGHAADMLMAGGDSDRAGGLRGPLPGEVFHNPKLASVFRELGTKGAKDGFYSGKEDSAIAKAVSSHGGVLSEKDLASHQSLVPDSVPSVDYHGIQVFQHPPNGQGIAVLLALQILRGLSPERLEYGSVAYFHMLIEVLRLAFADTRWFVADPEAAPAPLEELLSEAYAKKRRALFNPARAQADIEHGTPLAGSDTVSFQVVDGQGMAVSMVNSNYMGFGSGLVPEGCGFSLQNRGAGFSLEAGHPNALAGGRRPFHTIIPALALKDGELYASFTNMGGFMQPQGHVQLLLDMVDFGMDPQTAIDQPRFCIMAADGTADGRTGGQVLLEEGIPSDVVDGLRRLGHPVRTVSGHDRSVFGRAQIVRKVPESGVLWGGSDGRADGLAMGF